MDEEIKNAAEEVESTPMPETPEADAAAEKKDLSDKIEDFRDKAADKLNDLSDKVEDKFDDLKEKFNEKKEEAQPKIDEAKEKIKDAMDTPDTTEEYDPADINGNKVMAILCYLGILILIPLFAAKNSKFVKFHLNQGIIVFLMGLIVWLISKVNHGLITWILDLIVLVFVVIGIINAAGGKAKELPLVGKIRIFK
ncbi:MAG: hypothetical protein IKX03_01705 [Bacteroidales bacterium]|nr:hypothetical protein [Bacteroidales bacterium]